LILGVMKMTTGGERYDSVYLRLQIGKTRCVTWSAWWGAGSEAIAA